MVLIIQRLAKLSAIFVFFLITLIGFFTQDINDLGQIVFIFFKASIGALFFWIIGIVISDIGLKGLLDAVDPVNDNKWEGGLLTRFVEEKERVSKPMEEEELAQTLGGGTGGNEPAKK